MPAIRIVCPSSGPIPTASKLIASSGKFSFRSRASRSPVFASNTPRPCEDVTNNSSDFLAKPTDCNPPIAALAISRHGDGGQIRTHSLAPKWQAIENRRCGQRILSWLCTHHEIPSRNASSALVAHGCLEAVGRPLGSSRGAAIKGGAALNSNCART